MEIRATSPGPTALNFFRGVFIAAAIYNGGLGLVFFFLYYPVFEQLSIPLPDNTSYIHISAAFVFVQGVGYWFVYRNPLRNIDLVKWGVLYKAIYSAVAFYYLFIGELIGAVFGWFAVFDLIFLALFVTFLAMVRTEIRETN
jgi:hypothetical protein